MKKVKYNGTYIYVDDSPLDENETGILYDASDTLENTKKIDDKMIKKIVDESWSNDDDKN